MSSTERVHARGQHLGAGSSAREVVDLLHRENAKAVKAAGRARLQLAEGAELIAAALRAGHRLIYVGAGTSGRLGALDAAECPPTFGTEPWQVVARIAGGPKALTRAVEGAEDGDGAEAVADVRPGDVVCGITASGTTPWVISALRDARRRGATTLLVCCTRRRAVKVDVRICLLTGAEVVAGSTRLKAGTATKLALNALTTAAMVRLGRVEGGRMARLRPTNAKLKRRAVGIVADLLGIDEASAARRLEAAGDVAGALR